MLQLYREAVPQFQEFLLASMDEELCRALMRMRVRGADKQADRERGGGRAGFIAPAPGNPHRWRHIH